MLAALHFFAHLHNVVAGFPVVLPVEAPFVFDENSARLIQNPNCQVFFPDGNDDAVGGNAVMIRLFFKL